MNSAEKQLVMALRTTAFSNAAIADRLAYYAKQIPELERELLAMASQLEKDADTLEVFVKEIHEGRIVRSP